MSVTIKNVSKNMASAHYGEPVGWRKEVQAGESIEVSEGAAKYLVTKNPKVWEITGKESTKKKATDDKEE